MVRGMGVWVEAVGGLRREGAGEGEGDRDGEGNEWEGEWREGEGVRRMGGWGR